MPLDTGRNGAVWAVAFHADGKHVLGGNGDGLQRWQLSDGRQVEKRMGMDVYAISVSRDDKWVVCGTDGAGASVWDSEMRTKVVDVEGDNTVDAVDVSADSTRFATGTNRKEASIWSITTGERLVGPLEHDAGVLGIRFSPSGVLIATCAGNSIRIFDSRTGDKLVAIDIPIPIPGPTTPIAWSSDGQQILAASFDNNIRAFDASTGTQLTESQILHDGHNDVPSIALAANGKFIATFAECSISFLDTSTLARIGPIIEDSKRIWSVAISADSTRLATGQYHGKIIIRDLTKILPDAYTGPFDVSVCALPRSIPNVDKTCRYLLANTLNKTTSL